MKIVTMSDIGNVRKVNQDYVRYYQKSEQESLIVLCDGMGGHNAGEIASQMVCDDIIEHYQEHSSFVHDEDIRTWLSSIINHAHQLVKKKSFEAKEYEGMGTTVALLLYQNGDVYISHVGDSRVYFVDENLHQLTKDDTLVNVLVDSGTISADEAKIHPQKNILLQAVGVSDFLNVSFYHQHVDHGFLMVCSDGLYNSLSDEEILQILHKETDLEKKAAKLMEQARIYGGNDNISFALIVMKGAVER